MAELRPLSFGEILDGALTLYRRHFGLFLQLSIVVLAIPVALYGYFLLPLLGEQLMLAMMVDKVGTVLRLTVFGGVLYIGSLILTAATVRVVSDSYLGRAPTLGPSLKLGLSKIWPLFVVALGKGVVVGGLTGLFAGSALVSAFLLDRSGAGAGAMAAGLLIVVLGVWLVSWVASGYGVTTQVVVLGKTARGLDAFGHSWRLTRGSRRKIFGLAVVAFLLFNLVPTLIFTIVGAIVGPANPVLGTTMKILELVVPMILAPAIACVFTLMYYDLRVRREAFDLQVLGQQLGSA